MDVNAIKSKAVEAFLASGGEEIGALVDLALRNARAYLGVSETSADLSDRAKKVVEVLGKYDFNGNAEYVAEIASAILGEPVPAPARRRGAPLTPGLLLVPVRNGNGHDYRIGEPVLTGGRVDSSGNSRGIRADGTTGNWLPANATDYRLPTREEALHFFVTLALSPRFEAALKEAGLELPKAEPAEPAEPADPDEDELTFDDDEE